MTTGLMDRTGALFFIGANGMMQNVMGVLSTFSNERAAVLREQENGFYTTFPYYVAKLVATWPVKIFSATIFAFMMYFAVGFQQDWGKFGIALANIVLLALAGNAMGMFLACIFPDVSIGLLVAPLVVMPLMMFSGVFLNPDSVPIYFFWVQWISPMKYAFSALAINEFSGLKMHCEPHQYRTIPTSDGVAEICPHTTGDSYLETLAIQDWLSVSMCMLLLATMTAVFTILAYLGLRHITRKAMISSYGSATATKKSRFGRCGPQGPHKLEEPTSTTAGV